MKQIFHLVGEKVQALKRANGCPGCANHPLLPKVHLCLPPMVDGKFRRISEEQSMILNEILEFLTSSTIPWIKSEISLRTNLMIVQRKKAA